MRWSSESPGIGAVFARYSAMRVRTVSALSSGRRLNSVEPQTSPILPIYEARDIVTRVDGMAAMDEVGAAIDAVLDIAAMPSTRVTISRAS
jgi:adenylate kinase family enzyme